MSRLCRRMIFLLSGDRILSIETISINQSERLPKLAYPAPKLVISTPWQKAGNHLKEGVLLAVLVIFALCWMMNSCGCMIGYECAATPLSKAALSSPALAECYVQEPTLGRWFEVSFIGWAVTYNCRCCATGPASSMQMFCLASSLPYFHLLVYLYN